MLEPPRNMETVGIRKGLDSLTLYIKEKIIIIAHDHDGTTSNVFNEEGSLKISKSLDSGHATQEIKRKANNHYEEVAGSMKEKGNLKRKTIKKCFEIFSMLIIQLIAWFKYLIYNVC